MPTVPRYSAQVTPGISQARQNISASPAAFGGQEARALGQVGQGLSALAQRSEEIQAENDELQAREAYVAASDAARDITRGEGGYLTLQGRNAYEGYDDFAEEIERLPNNFIGGMSDRARERFLEMWAARRESALNQGASHAAGQRRAYAEQVFEAQISEASISIVENRGDLEAHARSVGELEAAIRERGAALGTPPEAIDQVVQVQRSQVLMASVMAAVDSGDTNLARSLFSRYEDDILDSDEQNIRSVLSRADMVERAQSEVDQIYRRFGTDASDARRYIRENFSGDMEDELIRRYNVRASEEEATVLGFREREYERALQMVLDGTPVDELPRTLRLGTLDQDYLMWLRLVEQSGIDELATDISRWRYLMGNEISAAELARVDLSRERMFFNDEDFGIVARRVMAARESGAGDPQEVSEAMSIGQQISAYSDLAGIDPNEDPELAARFRLRAAREIQAYERTLDGRQATPEERRDILDGLLVEVTVAGRGVLNRRTREQTVVGLLNYNIRTSAPQSHIDVLDEIALARTEGGLVTDEKIISDAYEQAIEELNIENPGQQPSRAELRQRISQIIVRMSR